MKKSSLVRKGTVMQIKYLIGGKKVGKNFRRGKILSGKYLVTSEKLVTFPRPIFKIKRTFMSGTAFFPEKSYSLSLGFFKLNTEDCTVGVTKPILSECTISCCVYISVIVIFSSSLLSIAFPNFCSNCFAQPR